MTGQREMRGTKLRDAVALFTAILVRRGRELPVVNVLMATAALRLGDSKYGALALGDVALVAFHLRMFAFEWIAAGRMLFHAEGRGLEAVHLMAGGAIAAARQRRELPSVVVRVAVGAGRMGHRRFEITLGVTFAARYAAVLSKKRKCRFGVVEAFELRYSRPTGSAVARLARSFETALMRICMAAGACGEREPGVLNVGLGIGNRSVALRAGHGRMRSCQWEFRGRMVEC
jgi:hypothetical protein